METWNKNWIRSKSPREQRKYVHLAPLHIARKLMSVRLTKVLKEKYGKRNIPVRTGDTVKIMSGDFKGKTTKVNKVSLVYKKVYVDDVFNLKKDGTKIPIALHPSKLMIMELVLEDKERKKVLDRK